MIKVTHSFPVWLPQTQTWLYNQIKYAPADKIESHIACERTENLDQFLLPNIHLPRKLKHFGERLLVKLKIQKHTSHIQNILKKTGSHILHSHFANVGWNNISAAKKSGVKHAVSFYGYDVNMLPREQIWLRRYKELFQNVDLILCEGPHMADCIKDLGCPKQKINVQRLGVDMLKLPYKKRIWQKGEKFKVLISGTFRQKKGIPYALESLAEVQNDIPMEITIIGDGVDPLAKIEKRKILNILKEKSLEQVTTLNGYQPHSSLIEEAYKNHLFISPSIHADNGDSEGGVPVTIIEMAKTGIPVITTNHCDIPYALKEYDEVLFSDERDIVSLARVIRLFWSNWYEYMPMIQKQAKYIEEHYNYSSLSQNIAKLYASIS